MSLSPRVKSWRGSYAGRKPNRASSLLANTAKARRLWDNSQITAHLRRVSDDGQCHHRGRRDQKQHRTEDESCHDALLINLAEYCGHKADAGANQLWLYRRCSLYACDLIYLSMYSLVLWPDGSKRIWKTCENEDRCDVQGRPCCWCFTFSPINLCKPLRVFWVTQRSWSQRKIRKIKQNRNSARKYKYHYAFPPEALVGLWPLDRRQLSHKKNHWRPKHYQKGIAFYLEISTLHTWTPEVFACMMTDWFPAKTGSSIRTFELMTVGTHITYICRLCLV